MSTTAITNVRSVFGEVGSIFIKDGVITAVGETDAMAAGRVVDAGGVSVLPGFIDIHIHGAIGIDVNGADAEGLLAVGAFLARHGVSAWVPTLVPDSDENYRRVIEEIDRLIRMQEGKPVAQAIGVHYEGVFANAKMCGALRPQYFKSGLWLMDGSRLPMLRNGVHLTTLAPEVEGGVEAVGSLVESGWIVSIGHTQADGETLDAAFAAGARHITHFFNAMTGIHHRDIGVAGWGLSNREVTFDIIADGIHVHPQMLELACRAKSPEMVSLISDSVAPTGLGDGEFEIWGEKIAVENRRTRNERGSIAGSVITMLDAVRQMRSLGFTDAEVSQMASVNPARLLGLDAARGSIEVGKRADLVGFRPDGSIGLVMIGGELVDLS